MAHRRGSVRVASPQRTSPVSRAPGGCRGGGSSASVAARGALDLGRALERVACRSSDRGRVARVCRVAAGVAWFRAGTVPSSAAVPRPASSAHRNDRLVRGLRRPRPRAPRPRSSSTSSARCGVGASCACGAGSRVVDAIEAVGGATPDADLTRLNLAAPLVDGSRIVVPRLGAPAPALDPTAVSGAPAQARPSRLPVRPSTSMPRPPSNSTRFRASVPRPRPRSSATARRTARSGQWTISDASAGSATPSSTNCATS